MLTTHHERWSAGYRVRPHRCKWCNTATPSDGDMYYRLRCLAYTPAAGAYTCSIEIRLRQRPAVVEAC